MATVREQIQTKIDELTADIAKAEAEFNASIEEKRNQLEELKKQTETWFQHLEEDFFSFKDKVVAFIKAHV